MLSVEQLFDVDYGNVDVIPLEVLTAPGRKSLDEAMRRAAQALIPNRPMDIVAWCEANLRFSHKTTKQSGPVRFLGYQKGIMRACQEDGAEIVSIMAVPRIGKSTLFSGIASYYAAHEGDDTAYYERSDGPLHVFHDTFLWPLMEASPIFRGLIRDGDKETVKDKWQDRLLKNGAAIRLRCASTNGAFRQIRARRLLADEVDDPAWQPGEEGSKIDLLMRRGQNYIDGCAVIASSPTDAETSVIGFEYGRSDKRVYDVPCPHCGTMQELLPRVGEKDGPGLKYTFDERTRRILDVWYQCANEACRGGGRIEEDRKRWMFDHGDWRATATPERPGLIGFYLWAIHSVDPKSSWKRIAEAHQESLHNASKRQTWKNTWLGQPWERVDVGIVSLHYLASRCERYPAEVPDPVRGITWGMDTQQGQDAGKDNRKEARHEMVFWGWGYGDECWTLHREVINEDPFSDEAIRRIVEMAGRGWVRSDGSRLRAAGGGMDVNYLMLKALQFAYSKEGLALNILPMVGMNSRARTPLFNEKRVAEHKATGRRYHQLTPQTTYEAMLRNQRLPDGPDSIHYPDSFRGDEGQAFFKSFTAIKRVSNTKTGRSWYEDKPGNEVVDCYVYGYAAHQMLKVRHQDYGAAFLRRPVPGEFEPYEGPGAVDRSYLSELGRHDRENRVAVDEAPARRLILPPGFGRKARRPGGRVATSSVV